MKTFWKIFIGVIALAVLVAGLLVVIYFTNNFTTSFSTFYVQCAATEYRKNSTVKLQLGVYYTFDCKYTLGFPKNEKGDRYYVSVEVNEAAQDIAYTVSDKPTTLYPKSPDISNSFEIERETNRFTIKVIDGTLNDILLRAYQDKTVNDIPDVDLSEKPYFSLVIKSYNEKTVIRLGICIIMNTVT